jgi:hypothetical protein
MLLTEEQTKYYLTDMIQFYGEKEQDAVTSEPEYKKKAFEDMKIVLFGDDYNGSKRKEIT